MLKIKIAIIDADLIGRSKHRFPNLVCMKLSKYYKDLDYEVELKMDYKDLENYDKVFISKVFMDTELPNENPNKSLKTEDGIIEFYKDHPILNLPNVEYGGTGFYYNKSPKLSVEIEHTKPDYHLYDDWVQQKISKEIQKKEKKTQELLTEEQIKTIKNDFTYYTDWSIGFTTRGCIRGCSFCVNKNYKECILHSSLDEFIDTDRKYICLLDDNIFACKDWRSVFKALENIGKRFQFKQGVDERLLTDEKCEVLFNSKWIGDFIFAFDNIKDAPLIENKLKLIRNHTNKVIKFYTFCSFNHDNIGYYDKEFWHKDITNLFERIKILMKYSCLPYVMRYKDFENSPYRGTYINLAAWCNQPSQFKKRSYREWCICEKERGHDSTYRYYKQLESDFPDIAEKYFDLKYEEINEYSTPYIVK